MSKLKKNRWFNQRYKLINGIVLDKEIVHGGMPKRIENAKIVLIVL